MPNLKKLKPIVSLLIGIALVTVLTTISFAAPSATLSITGHTSSQPIVVVCKLIKITKQTSSASPNIFQACVLDAAVLRLLDTFNTSGTMFDAKLVYSEPDPNSPHADVIGHVEVSNAKLTSVQHTQINHVAVVNITFTYDKINETWVKGGIPSLETWSAPI